ncbi:DUF2059 domain-containing protein [Gaetbulibacter aestuarii]|uniref:DUF2059 domain-containing protein n=1 Tax=Gaetbulibacter aestuarii TaxID=1502358 RepID=A0ABW7MUP5_9FLAO
MKTFLLAGLMFLGLTLNLNAQSDDSYKQETIEFIKLTGATKAFQNAIAQIGQMVPEDKKVDYTAEAEGTLDDLYSKMADIYMAEFTQGEIEQLVAFYKTDLGKKLASKQTSLTQKAMGLGQNWGMEVSAIAQKYQ